MGSGGEPLSGSLRDTAVTHSAASRPTRMSTSWRTSEARATSSSCSPRSCTRA